MDFFVVPTATFRLLHGWFAIDHERRRILHFDVTDAPTSAWVIQQLRETFGLGAAPRHLICDRDAIFSKQVMSTISSFGIEPTRTAGRSPWQNGVAERWIATLRRELLEHAVILNERHLRHLLGEYVAYYNNDRTHLGLDKQTPSRRTRSIPRSADPPVSARARVGGLHHRYDLAA
jgi:transposase InsO family protein